LNLPFKNNIQIIKKNYVHNLKIKQNKIYDSNEITQYNNNYIIVFKITFKFKLKK